MSSTNDVNKDKTETKIRIKLTLVDRIFMTSLFFIQLVLFILFLIMMMHYTLYPLPILFSTPSLLFSPYLKTSYIYNAFLYSLFFVQHVVMALITFKVSLKEIWIKYPLYERYIYNVSSSITEILIFTYAKPVSDIVFTSPSLLNHVVSLIATIILINSMIKLGGDLFSPFPLSNILFSQYLQVKQYTISYKSGLVNTGLYGYVRHPMQSSVIILLIFGSNIYTVDSLIFITVNILGIIIGVYFQENRLRRKFIDYKNYEKQVKYKFIPYLI